jgi:tRNA(Ile)-lysidine synthase
MEAPQDDRAIEKVLESLAVALPRRGFWDWPFLVGVSGGADSVALLLLLLSLVRRRGEPSRIIVAHAHHGLRPEADADHDFVVGLAADLGFRCTSARHDVPANVGRGGEGLEAVARRLRYQWLGHAAHEAGARHLLVAHTADDQAETILHRILRGTGVAGLSGMKPARQLVEGVALLRPLLGVRRAELRRFLSKRGQAWREDSSNADRHFSRAFLRHEIVPRLEQGPWPAATEALVRLGQQAAGVAGALASVADMLLERHCRSLAGGGASLDAVALRGLDDHLLAAMFATLWRQRAWPERDMGAVQYGRLVALLRDEHRDDRGEMFPGGLRASATASGRLEIGPPTDGGPAMWRGQGG